MALVARGTVKWFNESSGYGYIVADEGGRDLFVHRGSIVGDWCTTTLAEETGSSSSCAKAGWVRRRSMCCH
jgi:cold shock CspA family protein